MQVSARDVDREHRTQAKRWRKKRGEPSRKPLQRLHSARAIMAIEPHTRQDLRQNPTIIVQYPSIPEEISESGLRKKRGSLKKNQILIPNIPNPYALSSEPKLDQIPETQPLSKENQDSVLSDPPSYPAPLPKKPENQPKEMNSSTERLVQTPLNSSVIQKPAESLPLQPLSLVTAPVHESPPQWRPHLLASPLVQFSRPCPDHENLPNKTSPISDPHTDLNPLLLQNSPANDDPGPPKDTLCNSTESVNSSEDTYL